MWTWTNVNDAMPDAGERVLVYGDYPVYGNGVSYRRGITVGKYDAYSGKFRPETFIGLRVIAWMPLPEPPKGV